MNQGEAGSNRGNKRSRLGTPPPGPGKDGCSATGIIGSVPVGRASAYGTLSPHLSDGCHLSRREQGRGCPEQCKLLCMAKSQPH